MKIHVQMTFVKCHHETLCLCLSVSRCVTECKRQLLYSCPSNLVSLLTQFYTAHTHTCLQCCFLPKRPLQPSALCYLWERTGLSRCIVLNDSLRLEINLGKYNSADTAACCSASSPMPMSEALNHQETWQDDFDMHKNVKNMYHSNRKNLPIGCKLFYHIKWKKSKSFKITLNVILL